jgi:N-methylhydantoinase B
MIIDLSGCAKERQRGLNSRTLAGARIAYKALTQPLAPVNEGSFRALDIVLPEGTIMMARYPAPMTGWSRILPTVVDTIVRSLAPAMPDRVPAAHHGVMAAARSSSPESIPRPIAASLRNRSKARDGAAARRRMARMAVSRSAKAMSATARSRAWR